jgi:hypothetical protein
MKLYRIHFISPAPEFIDVDADTPDEAVETAIGVMNRYDFAVSGELEVELIARSQ